MTVMNLSLLNSVELADATYSKEDKELFNYVALDILKMLNDVNGDFLINVISEREISLRNVTACPCFNEFKTDGCGVVEELVNEICNDFDNRFSANFISCSKDGHSCCELLLVVT